MGIKNRLKKKAAEKEKPEEIGGLLEDAVLPARHSDAPPAAELPALEETPSDGLDAGFAGPLDLEAEPNTATKDDDLSALDIFASETAEDEDENRLADQLPQIDIHDLLDECRQLAERFKQHKQ